MTRSSTETACPSCGESLIGHVNQCWKCGQAVPSQAGRPPSSSPTPLEGNSPFSRDIVETPNADQLLHSRIKSAALTSTLVGMFALAASWFTGLGMVPALIGGGFAIWSLRRKTRARRSLAVIGLLISLLAMTWSGLHGYRQAVIWYQDFVVYDDF